MVLRLVVEQEIAKVAKILDIGFAHSLRFCELFDCACRLGATKKGPAYGLSHGAKESSQALLDT